MCTGCEKPETTPLSSRCLHDLSEKVYVSLEGQETGQFSGQLPGGQNRSEMGAKRCKMGAELGGISTEPGQFWYVLSLPYRMAKPKYFKEIQLLGVIYG